MSIPLITVKVNLYANFRLQTGQKSFLLELPYNCTLMDAILAITEKFPVLAAQWLDARGDLRPFVHCFVNEREFLSLKTGVATRLGDGDILDFFPPVAGGHRSAEGIQ